MPTEPTQVELLQHKIKAEEIYISNMNSFIQHNPQSESVALVRQDIRTAEARIKEYNGQIDLLKQTIQSIKSAEWKQSFERWNPMHYQTQHLPIAY